MSDKRERALTHIARCDAIFDDPRRPDREFAYFQMRLLALELLELLEELEFEQAPLLWREWRRG